MREPEWKTSTEPVLYPEALTAMEDRVERIIAGKASDQIWLLEHPPLYTGGTSSRPEDLSNPLKFPVYDTGRGGQFTYHGPGQRVAYVIKKLEHQDIRRHVYALEQWVIDTLAAFAIQAERREGRIGLWVQDKKRGEAKIAAIGVRVRKWVAYHGVAINVNPDLSHFEGIIPCGIREFGVTSMHELGQRITLAELDAALKKTYRD